MLLLSVRMALPHYRRGGAVNGRIGAVDDVALTSPEGDTAASAGELRHTWHPWLLSHPWLSRRTRRPFSWTSSHYLEGCASTAMSRVR